MSTNQNTQQINVFNKGMNTDTSDAYIPSEQYRYAENLRFITDTGGDSGELRLIEGYEEIKDLRLYNVMKVLAVDGIRNIVAIICNTRDYNKTGDTLATILVWNKDIDEVRRIFLARNEKGSALGWNTEHFSTVTRWESNDNVKLYIADGIHPLMQADISWKDDFDPIVDAITSFDGLYQTGGGNVFHGFGDIIRTTGLLKPAIVQYAYILYKKNGGRSNISPSTQPISLYSDSTIHRGLMDNPYTDVGLIVTVNEKKSNRYDKILVYRITYSEQGQQPNIDLIFDDNLSATTDYTFTDTGQNPIESGISFAEFVAQDYMEISPQYIESKNDYLFAGNFTYYKRDDVLEAYENWDAHENVTCELDYDDAVVLTDNHSAKRSLQRGEQYRYGIVLYDKYGNKWPVKHVKDVEVPNYGENGFLDPYRYDDEGILAVSAGINVTVSNLDKDLFPYYEIVRVSRNWNHRRCISQGIVGRTMLYVGYTDREGYSPYSGSNAHYPSGLITMGNVEAYENISDTVSVTATTEGSTILLFCSPEISYGDYLKDVLDAYDGNLQLNIIYEIKTDYKEDAIPIMYPEDHPAYDSYRYVLFGSNGWRWDFRKDGDTEIISANRTTTYFRHHPDYTTIDIHRRIKNTVVEIYPAQNVVLGDLHQIVAHRNSKWDIPYSSTKIAEAPEFDHFANSDKQFTYNDDVRLIGNSSFINWSTAQLEYCLAKFTDEMKDHFVDGGTTHHEYCHPVGAGGKCLLIDMSEHSSINSTYRTSPTIISVARIINKLLASRENIYGQEQHSIYSSFGNYFENDGRKHNVYDGDCYIQLFYYNALKTFLSGMFPYVPKMSTVYIVPVETPIDMNSDYGDSYKRISKVYNDDMYVRYIQDSKVVDLYGYNQDLNAYMYNTAYSSEPTIKVNSSVDIDDLKDNQFDYRVAHSQLKSNNERYDSWLQFKSADYLDVDTRYGEITNLRLFKDLMMFWQKSAVGILSVNERTMLQDSTDTNIILGNGDTLLRYDYLSTIYGMKPHQQCDAQSDTTLYWWDGYHKDILAYPGGHNVLPTKKEKTISGYINKNDEIDKPVLAYDTKYNELLACVVDNNPLVYSEIIQQYTSVYKTPFERRVNMPDGLILFNGEKIYEWNQRDEGTIKLFPLLEYVVNNNSTFVKVYDNTVLGMGDEFYYNRFYNSGEDTSKRDGQPITIKFNTLGQKSTLNSNITDREYDLRFAIPRNSETTEKWDNNWGERMRGRTMTCELSSSSNDKRFSLQYIITKYRISWS